MPTNPLTAADLDAIEARHTTTLDNGERVIDEDTARLLSAVRQARALVGRLAVDDPGNSNSEWGEACVWCRAEMYTGTHAPDCAWQAAREAVEAWNNARNA